MLQSLCGSGALIIAGVERGTAAYTIIVLRSGAVAAAYGTLRTQPDAARRFADARKATLRLQSGDEVEVLLIRGHAVTGALDVRVALPAEPTPAPGRAPAVA